MNAKSLHTFVETVNKRIYQDLEHKKEKKNFHYILPRYVTQRKTFCKALYEIHLA